MYHPDPWDEYPISDGSIEVSYYHDRKKYIRLLYQDFVVDLDSKSLEHFSKTLLLQEGLLGELIHYPILMRELII